MSDRDRPNAIPGAASDSGPAAGRPSGGRVSGGARSPQGARRGQKGSSTGKIAAVVAVLVLLGLAVWAFLPADGTRNVVDDARQQISRLTGTEDPAPQTPAATGESLPVTEFGADGQVTASSGAGVPAGDGGADLPASNPQGTSGAGNVVQPPVDMPGVTPLPEALPGLEHEQNGPDRIDEAVAGQTATVASRLPEEQQAAVPGMGGALSQAGAPDGAGRGSDSVVTPDFVRDAARWLVSSYRPGQNGGRTTVTLMAANRRYGTALTGLRHAAGAAGREAVLHYVWSPGMLEGLYSLYVERFMSEVEAAARSLSAAQTVDMLTLYAGRFQQMGAALHGVATLPDFHERVSAVHHAGQEINRANSVFAEVLYAYDQAREERRQADAAVLEQRVREATQAIRRAEDARAAARAALTDGIKSHAGGRTPGNDTLLYLAEWVDRRGENSGQTAGVASDLFFRLSERFDAQARAVGGSGPQAAL